MTYITSYNTEVRYTRMYIDPRRVGGRCSASNTLFVRGVETPPSNSAFGQKNKEKALQSYRKTIKNYFGYCFATVNIEITEDHQR